MMTPVAMLPTLLTMPTIMDDVMKPPRHLSVATNLARPITLGSGVGPPCKSTLSALEALLMDDEKYTAIPRSSELFRAQVLREGAVGWASLACQIAGEAMADLKNAMAADELLSFETMRRPYRMAAAALLVPYLPLSAIEQA